MPDTDLNHIKLSAFVLTALYHDSIVKEQGSHINQPLNESEQVPVVLPTEKKSQTNWNSLGDNQKNILVVVNNPGFPFLPDDELTFLTGVLSACKLSIADITILNIAENPGASYKEIISFFKSRIVLLFAISPLDFGLPINFPYYQIQPFAGNSFLFAPSLKSLSDDKIEKTKLWVSLKRLFNI